MARASTKKRVAPTPLYRSGDYRRRAAARDKTGDFRTEFGRDLARLVHSPGFRRLQGKTQLFPSHENDFYRNRLTHSLEVAQIATGIATNLNGGTSFFRRRAISLPLVTFAALAHDLGHPPFGHNGERVLDQLMIDHGGFEGNAQTLRILARLEKKETLSFPARGEPPNPADQNGDHRLGLNPTLRSLASVLKYHDEIPHTKASRRKAENDRHPVKGYYFEDRSLVQDIQSEVFGSQGHGQTVECSIMDAADDIAYSTYDMEDAFKAGFLSPTSMLSIKDEQRVRIVENINKKIARDYPEVAKDDYLTEGELFAITKNVLAGLYDVDDNIEDLFRNREIELNDVAIAASIVSFESAKNLSNDGYLRTDFTSRLVYKFMQGIELLPDEGLPAASVVRLNLGTFKVVETLKNIVYTSQTLSPGMKVAERRGKEIVTAIFKTLTEEDAGSSLLPRDWREIYEAADSDTWRFRTVCDFIASMTDRYCVEFYARIVGIEPPSIHKPF